MDIAHLPNRIHGMPTSRLLDALTEVLGQVLRFQHPAHEVLSRFLRQRRAFGSRDRRLLGDAVFAVLRYRLRDEHLAAEGGGGPPLHRALALLGLDAVLAEEGVLWTLLSPEESAWLSRCRQVPPALLPPACQHNLPDWLARRLQGSLGSDFDALAQSLLQGAPLDLRVNVHRTRRSEIADALALAGITSQETPYSPWGLRVSGKLALQQLDVFRRGLVEVQDEGSQILALLTRARRGQMVADFCAGAGGKTLALGALMRDTGRLYALDSSASRLRALQPRLQRSGLGNVYTMALATESDARLHPLHGKMDGVLVDAPCSGLGTLRRNPDLKWRQTPQAVQDLVRRQQAILHAAARLLKPGGRLVYATCSLLEQENEELAAQFDQSQPSGWQVLPVASELQALRVPQADSLCSPDGRYLRLWPHRHQTDGFFAAVWQRR